MIPQVSGTTPDSFGLVGQTLGDKYLIEAVVDSGGFSVVYRAMHLFWRRPVAIKAFKAASGLTSIQREQLLGAFVREGALLAELSEKSLAICQAHDIGAIVAPSGDWVPYLVLEWLRGSALDVQLTAERDKGSLPRSLVEAIALLSPAVAALSIAHNNGISHLDLKPANLFVLKDKDGSHRGIKLLDFGVAKVVARVREGMREAAVDPQLRSFTPENGAPEQFFPELGLTGPSTDVFGLALIVVELVTGTVPLSGASPGELGRAAVDPTVRPTPRTRGATVSDDVERVFRRALDVDPKKRFGTASDFWEALELAAADELLEPFLLDRLAMRPRAESKATFTSPSRRWVSVMGMGVLALAITVVTIEATRAAKRLGVRVPVAVFWDR